MLLLRNLTKSLKATKHLPQTTKSTKLFSPSVGSLFSSKNTSISHQNAFGQQSTSSFCTAWKAFTCEKIKDIQEELKETMRNNIEDIVKMLPGRGINVSSFCLNRFAHLLYTEDKRVYNILYNNIENEIGNVHDTTLFSDIFEGFSIIQSNPGTLPQVPKTLLEKTFRQLLKITPLFSDKLIQKFRGLAAPFEKESIPELSEFLQLTSVSRPFSISEFLDAINARAMYEEVKDQIQITQFDINRNYLQLKYAGTNQTLDLFGCESYPSDSIDQITHFINSHPNQIHTLLLEDNPLLMPNEDIEEMPEEGGDIDQALEKEEMTLLYDLFGEDLFFYTNSFTQDENLFHFDKEKRLIYSKINPKFYLPSEIGTATVHFMNNINLGMHPTITLIDLTLPEMIGKMAGMFSIEQLRELLKIMNYCTLIEKSYFSEFSRKKGCIYCKGPEVNNLPVPKDMISIVSGDKEFPLNYKTEFLARIIYSHFEDPELHDRRSLAIVGSFYAFDVVRNLLLLAKKEQEGTLPEFDRENHLSETTIDLKKDNTNINEKIEKLALLETVFQMIDSDAMKRANPGEMEDQIMSYMNFGEQYANEISYEKLAMRNRAIPIRPGECGAETLIFGVGGEEGEEPSIEDRINANIAEHESDEEGQEVKIRFKPEVLSEKPKVVSEKPKVFSEKPKKK